MNKTISISLLAALLTGCAAESKIFSDRKLVLISEECRAQAMEHVPATGAVWEKTERGWRTSFDREYHACMAAKGVTQAQRPSS